jgi:hypothetical protein
VKKLARQASKKLKERVGEGGGDARPNPKPSHNLDLSSLKPLPEKRKVGSGVKKLEIQSKLGSPNPAEEEGIDDLDFPVSPLPSATYVGPFSRRRPWRFNRDEPK